MNILFYNEISFPRSETFIKNQLYNPLIEGKFLATSKIIQNSFDPTLISDYIIVDTTPVTIVDRILSKIIRVLRGTGKYTFPRSTERLLEGFIRRNRISAIHCNYGNNAIKFLNISEKLNIPLICHFHGYDSSSLLKDKTYRILIKRVFKHASAAITVSQEMTVRLIKIGLKQEKIFKIPYGTDLELYNKNTSKEILHDQKPIKILHAGRLTAKKGVLDLVKVIQKVLSSHSNILFDIIGEGEEYATIKDYITTNNLSNHIKLHGAKDHSIVINAMQEAEIFILNSRRAPNGDMEGYPNAIIEAMAAKCAVISTLHAGIPEIINNYENGILVEENNNNQLYDAIIEMVFNKKLRVKLQTRAQLKANEKFSIVKMFTEYLNLYNKITYRASSTTQM